MNRQQTTNKRQQALDSTDNQLEILTRESHVLREFQDDSEKASQQGILKIIENLKFRNYVLAVSHSDYLVSLGGTEKVLHEEQAELAKHNISYIQVYSSGLSDEYAKKKYLNQLTGVNVDSVPVGKFTVVQLGLILQILSLSGTANAVATHIHHLMKMSVLGVKHLINAAQAHKLRIFLHDYYTICPQINLLKNGREFCGGPPVNSSECGECGWKEARHLHFRMVSALFKSVDAEFMTPSRVAAGICSNSFPELANHIRVVPHQIRHLYNGNKAKSAEDIAVSGYCPKIAYIGYESVVKGLETWWRLTSESRIQEQYELFHLGASGMNIQGVKYIPVSFLEKGPDAMIDALKKYQIDIAFLWSICPETYSFSVNEAFAANCFVVTNKFSGNIADQVKETGRGVVFNDETEMFDFFKDVSRVKQAVRINLQENSLLNLKFNPELSIELANLLNKEENPHIDKDSKNIFHEKSSEWYYLLRKLESETDRADQIAYLEGLTDIELKTQLDVYRISKLHIFVEYVRNVMNKNPVIRRTSKKILLAVWNTVISLHRNGLKIIRQIKGER
ncbi:MAG: hypothetical protein GY795_13730 [Desulfobacterales bacterium]|nr:hypothetical protein [Desulfobacterales bacterium]